MSDLEGKVALVTGASRGIGRGIALVLAEKGAVVIVNYRVSGEEAKEVCERIQAHGGRAVAIQADVSRASDVSAMFATIGREYGRLDILVNNAGTTRAQDILKTELEDWDFIVSTNLTSAYLCSKHAMHMMRDQGDGRIVFVSSVVAHRGALYGHVHYAATKGGMLGMVKTLARTGAPLGIRVNAVAPGITETELLFETHGRPEIEKLAAQVPLGLGTPRDVGLAVAYLCGEAGSYITGATIDVNGGSYMR